VGDGGRAAQDLPDRAQHAPLRLQLIYVLTGGGPANSTHLLATYAYQVGVATGLLGEGAAISLFMLPVLFLVVVLQLRYLRKLEGA
jgi:multiple sugar transport system permease protein